jgi:hypothetical protein
MRQERTIQATIFEVFAQHEIGCALKAISEWLDGNQCYGADRQHGQRGANAPAERQYAAVGCGAGDDAVAAPGRAVPG